MTRTYTPEETEYQVRKWEKRFYALRPHVAIVQRAQVVTFVLALIIMDDWWKHLFFFVSFVALAITLPMLLMLGLFTWQYKNWAKRRIAQMEDDITHMLKQITDEERERRED